MELASRSRKCHSRRHLGKNILIDRLEGRAHLQLNVQLGHRTRQGAEVGQHVFTEVGNKTCGMDIFLQEKRKLRLIHTTMIH